MRQTIHKVFFVWNFDKEEKWLNEMTAKGLCLVSVGFCRYEFEDCIPGEYNICMQLLKDSPRHPESRKYIEFLEGTGAEQIGSFSKWIYLRKKAKDGNFELFSDHDSRCKHLSRIVNLILLITIANLLIGTYNVLIANWLNSHLNYIGLLNLAIGIWGIIGSIRLLKKRWRLRQDSQIFE